MEPQEIWKAIPGYEGVYEVSDLGRVRSLDRAAVRKTKAGTTKVFHKGKTLRPGRCGKQGHLSVALGRGKSKHVHVLVMLAFEGPRPIRFDVLHKNGDASDNRRANLRYGSRSENNKDMVYHGVRKLSTEQVVEIKIRLASKEYGIQRKLAREFKMSEATISSIKKGRLYAHVAY